MRCIYPFVSMTSVLRAKPSLEKANIRYRIVELSPNLTKRGCAFGIEVPCDSIDTAERAMRCAGVRYKEHIEI